MTRLIAFLLAMTAAVASAAASTSEGVRKWRAGDYAAAVALWQQPAAAGDADALFNLGQAYRLGRGVETNRDIAIDFYRRAAQRGHVAATANLGITLFGAGRKAEAFPHLRTAADRGDARAAYVLGLATFTGDGVARNEVLGLAYVQRAEQLGLGLAGPQVKRLSALVSQEQRARAEATATALAAGGASPVMLASRAPAPAPRDAPGTEVGSDASGEEAVTAADVVAATAPIAPATPARGWLVQLGAYASESAARSAWASLIAQSAALLDGQAPIYAPRAGLVRLQVGPFADRSEAAALCQRLSAAGRPCFVTGS